MIRRITQSIRASFNVGPGAGHRIRALEALAWIRVIMSCLVLAGGRWLVPASLGSARMWFLALIGFVSLPYSTFILVRFKRGHPHSPLGSAVSDMASIMLYQTALPHTRPVCLLAYAFVMTYSVSIGGLRPGLAIAAAAGILTAGAQAINPSPLSVNAFTYWMSLCVMVALTLVMEAGTREQRARDRFRTRLQVSAVTHEVRTPLTSITGYSKMLVDRWDVLDDPTRADMLKRIARNAVKLDDLVERLMELARLDGDADRPFPEPILLSESIASHVRTHEPAYESHNIHVEVSDQIALTVDTYAFDRIIGNLIMNAVKYAPAGSQIDVCATDRGNDVLVSVTDQGSGIPSEDQQRIFEPFFQRNRGASEPKGAGVGLALVRRYVTANGGRVWVESTPGRGATFCFTLPSAALSDVATGQANRRLARAL